MNVTKDSSSHQIRADRCADSIEEISRLLDECRVEDAVFAFRNSQITEAQRATYLDPKVSLALDVLFGKDMLIEAAHLVLGFEPKDVALGNEKRTKIIALAVASLREDGVENASELLLAFKIKRKELDADVIKDAIEGVGKLFDMVQRGMSDKIGAAITTITAFNLTREEVIGELNRRDAKAELVAVVASIF